MDPNDITILEHKIISAEAELHALNRAISILEQENRHLRQVIEMLITSKSPTI